MLAGYMSVPMSTPVSPRITRLRDWRHFSASSTAPRGTDLASLLCQQNLTTSMLQVTDHRGVEVDYAE